MALQFSKDSFHYRKLQRRRRLIVFWVILAALIIVGVIIAVLYLWKRGGQNSPSQTSQHGKTISFQPYKTFTTPYFEMQTDQDWQAMPEESNATTFVYRAFKAKLVERDLYIYINTLPPR